MTKSDQRKNIRAKVQLETHLKVGDKTYYGTCRNLSAKGVFFICRYRPPVGTFCELIIQLGDERMHPRVHVTGAVVRQDDQGVGIQLTGIDFKSYEHLKNVIIYSAEDPDRAEQEFKQYLSLFRL